MAMISVTPISVSDLIVKLRHQDVTKESKTKKKRVSFALPDYDSESESKGKDKSRAKKKFTPPKHRFEPPPPDLDIKVRPILKNKGAPVYQAPPSAPSLLPLHIINSIINSQLGPSILDSFGEDSESEKDECDSPPNNNTVETKNKNNLTYSHKTNDDSESFSVDDNLEENIDAWFLNSEESKVQKDPVSPQSPTQKSFLPNKQNQWSKNLGQKDVRSPIQRSDSSDSESSDTNKVNFSNIKLKSPKPRRKLKVTVEIFENGINTESEEKNKLKLDSQRNKDTEKESPEDKDASRILQPLNVSEVNYLDEHSELTFPKAASLEHSDVLSHLPPVILEQEAPLPLRISQNTDLNNPCWETFDSYFNLPRSRVETSCSELHDVLVHCHPVALQHKVEDSAQPINVAEINHLDYYCEEYSDSSTEPLRILPKTSSVELSRGIVSSQPVLVHTAEKQKETNVSEISYFDSCTEQYSDINESALRAVATQSPLENFHVVRLSHPTVVQNQIEEVERREKNPELRRNSKSRRKSSVQFSEISATEDKENLHQSPHSSEIRTEAQTNNVLQPLRLKSNTLPPSSNSSQLTNSTTEPLTLSPYSTQQPYTTSPYISYPLKNPFNQPLKKRTFTAVKLQGEVETNSIPSQRILKPYQRKPRQPLNLIMDSSQDLNCAGEPENLSPHKRDDIKEKDILIWIYNMIDEPARVDYEFFLKDGCILCKLMNRIKPGCIPEENITWEGSRSKQKNISNFLTQAEAYGVHKGKLFYPEDLLHLRHIPRVTRCIYALAKIAQEDPDLGPNCPRLGDEPNFVEEAKKVTVPGHRETKEVLNQITSSMQKQEESSGERKLQRMHSLYK